MAYKSFIAQDIIAIAIGIVLVEVVPTPPP